MAVSFSQNWASEDMVNDGFDHVLEVDSALLMSFLEETQGEECDHDQLHTVIKSLEAEIDCDSSHGIKVDRQTGLFDDDDYDDNQQAGYCHDQYYGLMGGQDCSSTNSSESFDFKWMDMDINMDTDNWYMNHFGCGNDDLIEYEGVGDVYSAIYPAGTVVNMGMEDQSYGSLWQES